MRSLSEQSSKSSTFFPLVAWHCSLAIRNSNAFDLSNSSAWKSFLAHPELGLLQLGEAEAEEEAFGSRFIVFDPRKKNKSEEVTAGLLPPYNMLHVMISCASRIWISPEGWSLQKTCELLQHGANSPAKMYTSAQSPVKQCSLLTDLTIVQKPKLAKIIMICLASVSGKFQGLQPKNIHTLKPATKLSHLSPTKGAGFPPISQVLNLGAHDVNGPCGNVHCYHSGV